MGWEEEMIALYLIICKAYQTNLWMRCQRFTNGGCKAFSDEEVMVIYLFSVLRGFRTLKSIHRYAKEHLSRWFPKLPNYEGYAHRVNRLSEAFRGLIENLQSKKIPFDDERVYLVDSFPIMLAQHQQAYRAKVAREVAGKSYHSTKKMYYYGVKAHVVGRKRSGTLPDIEIVMIESASRQDGPVFDQIRPMLHDNLVFGHQAYKRPDAQEVELAQNLKVITPIKKVRGQKKLEPDQRLFSKAVSRMRQPIETIFGWIQRLTGIQHAGNVRSTAGLVTHIFGRLAAAMIFNQLAVSDF
jgi:Transposase DDE domain